MLSESICLSGDSLTHTLTHTGECPAETSGTGSAKEGADSERKGLKAPIQRYLKGLATLRNQQVARSSRVTSSRKSPQTACLRGFFLSRCGCCQALTYTLTHKRKYPETIRNPRRASFICFPGILIISTLYTCFRDLPRYKIAIIQNV